MKLLMPLKDVRDAYGALVMLGKVPLQSVVAYRVSKLTKELKPHAESVDEAQQKLLSELGDPVEGTANYRIKDLPRFTAEMNALLDEQVEIDTQIKFRLTDFGDAKIEPSVFVGLDRFVEE
jgi:hypothetical protein